MLFEQLYIYISQLITVLVFLRKLREVEIISAVVLAI